MYLGYPGVYGSAFSRYGQNRRAQTSEKGAAPSQKDADVKYYSKFSTERLEAMLVLRERHYAISKSAYWAEQCIAIRAVLASRSG